MPEFLTTTDMMQILKVSKVTLSNWRKEGMPYEKFGRIVRYDKDKVLEWLRNKK